MTGAQIASLVPLIVLGGVAVLVMLSVAVRRNHAVAAGLTTVGLAAAMGLLALPAMQSPQQVSSLLIIDSYAVFYMAIILGAALVTTVVSYPYLRCRKGGEVEEYYILLTLAALGAAVLVCSSHFASFLLGLELLSIPLFALIAYRREMSRAVQGGVKYLVMAGSSSTFLLFGMALIYADRGTMQLAELAARHASFTPVFLAGLAMVLVGISFKLALVPFHMWAPDVYEASPAPVAGFIASVSKGALFALMLRYLGSLDVRSDTSVYVIFWFLAIGSMFAGNLLALRETNIKRILAFSSIAHMGYVTVAFLASGDLAGIAVAFYLTTYFIATLGAFAVIAAFSDPDRDAGSVRSYRGLAWRRPALALVLTGMLLSLAGLPLTAGFFGKFYVVTAGIGAGLWPLVIVLVINSAIALYYYLRAVTVMFRPAANSRAPRVPADRRGRARWPYGLALSVLAGALVWLGVYPTPLLTWIQAAVQGAH